MTKMQKLEFRIKVLEEELRNRKSIEGLCSRGLLSMEDLKLLYLIEDDAKGGPLDSREKLELMTEDLGKFLDRHERFIRDETMKKIGQARYIYWRRLGL